jgi:hypothetical protein
MVSMTMTASRKALIVFLIASVAALDGTVFWRY